MEDRMVTVVKAVLFDLRCPSNQLRVEELVRRSMLFGGVPKRMEKEILRLIRLARETGLLAD